MHVESYQWQIGLERILILPLAPCGFDTPYLSLPPLEIATMIPCTWGLSVTSVHPEASDNLLEVLQGASIVEEHRILMGTVVERVRSIKSGLTMHVPAF